MESLSPPPEEIPAPTSAPAVAKKNHVGLPQKIPAHFSKCKTQEEQTAWIIRQLRETSFNEVHSLLDASPVPKRLFVPREIRVDGELQAAPFKIDTQPRTKSFALLLLTERERSRTLCQACANIKSKGPASSCFQPEVKFGMGACTNCIYSGRGNLCSLRLALEAQEKKKKRLREGKPALLTERICQAATMRELESWKRMLEDCLRDAMVEEQNMREAE